MTAPTLVPDATRCPDCRATLAGTGWCSACGLRLTGPEATRLWEVDVELLGLERSRRLLLDEREALLRALRTAGAPEMAPADAAREPAEWTPQRVQNLLLTLGGLLLAGAALVFAAVTYERLGAGGRALVLGTLTALAAVAAPRLRTRGLTSTAETVGAVVLALAALDAYGLRTLGLAQDSAPARYAAGCSAVLAVLAVAYGRRAGLRLVQVLGVLLSQLPVPLLLGHAQAPVATVGLALAALAAADLAVLLLGDRLDEEVRATVRACAALVLAAAVAASVLAGIGADQPAPAATALLACAVVVAAASRLATGPGRALLSCGAVTLLGAAVAALLREDVAVASAALGAVALVAVLACTRLPQEERTGPIAGALLVATASVLAVALPVVHGLLAPLGWLDRPWTLPAGSSLREALPGGEAWTGPAVTPLVLLAAAATVLVAGHVLDRVGWAAAPAGALGLAAAVLLPLALDLPYAAGLAVLLVLAGLAAAGGAALLGRVEAVPMAAAGVALGLHAAAWSTASQTATLVVLPLVALGCAALAVPRQPRPAVPVVLAGLLATVHVSAIGTALDLAPDQVGGLLLVAVAGALAAAALLDGERCSGAELTALVAGTASLSMVSADVGWLSWVLAGLGLLALATALRPDRRPVAVAGGLLLSASSWVRLADAGVTAPEPYVLPLAAAALVLGALRRRAEPDTSSWQAYGPGLLLALVPSLLAGLGGNDLTRPLLVGLAALAVLLVGARTSLQAPLVVGGAVLLVDALDLVGPYAAALPRWLSLGGAGALLLLVGATYEQRRRDVSRLRDRYDALA
jgi:hypothetical protein